MLNKDNHNDNLILLMIILMIPLTGAGIDIYVPSMPIMVTYFFTSKTLVQISIGIYLLGYSLGQFFLGTFSDSFGRKSILIPSCFCYFLICIFITFSSSIKGFLLLRFLQGIAVSGPGVISKALLSDCFSGERLKKASNYLTIAWASGPTFAPVIGGYIQQYIGWRGNFYFLAIYSLLLLIAILMLLPEIKLQAIPFKLKIIMANYKMILENPIFIGGFLLITLGYSILTVFNVMGAFIIQNTLGYTSVAFGNFALFLGLAWLTGNILNRPLLNYFTNEKIIAGLIWTMVVMLSIIITVIRMFPMNIYTVLIPTCLLCIFGGLIMPNGVALTLSLFPGLGGTVNAIFSALYVLGASLMSFLASKFNTNTQMPLFYFYFFIGFACLVIYKLLLKPYYTHRKSVFGKA